MSTAYIELDGLDKSFGKRPALKDVSATIERGQMVGVVGPDGAGKTTLLRLLVGLLGPSSGRLQVAGLENFHGKNDIQNIIGYMPQKFGLYEDLTVQENLSLYADLRKVVPRERAQKFDRLLTLTRLSRFQNRLAGKLSGGMKQKLGLACALVGNPELLLLDEPSVGVDPISRKDLWDMVKELLSGGMTVLWSTAYLDEAERCDTVLLFNEGELLFSGPPAKILARVEGRCWHLGGVTPQNKRALLMKYLKREEVVDGLIQGENIRIVTRNSSPPKPLEQGIQIELTPPMFEDAFIDILGGAPKGSTLVESSRETLLSQDSVIQAEHLTKKFGDFTAAENIHFTAQRGEIFGLLGPNGAGKSTTFKMMCGLLQPSAGRATIAGRSLASAGSKARAKIGYMAQKFSLYGYLTVVQNLQFFAGLYGLAGKRKRRAIERMESVFELTPYMKSLSSDLPLGFKQRLSLACAVMHDPEVLFLDEPTSGVDPITRREFWGHINALVEKGVAVMVTTHFMDEAEYCDRINLISDGRSVAIGTPEELKTQAKEKESTLSDPSLEDAFVTLVGLNNIVE